MPGAKGLGEQLQSLLLQLAGLLMPAQPPQVVRERRLAIEGERMVLAKGSAGPGQGGSADLSRALVVPRGAFTVWWSVGDRVAVRRSAAGKSVVVEATVVARVALDPDRVDGRIAWRLRAT